MSFTMRFPSGVMANCLCGYDAFQNKRLTLHFERGSIEMPNAFAYENQRLMVSRRDGQVAAQAERQITPKNQFALEVDHFADFIREDRVPHTPGEEGAQDQQLMAALYRSASEGRLVEAPKPVRPTRGPDPQGS